MSQKLRGNSRNIRNLLSNEKLRLFLTEDDLILILLRALVQARKLESDLEVENKKDETDRKPKIHIAIAGKGKNYAAVVHSDNVSDVLGKRKAQERALASLKHIMILKL